MYRSILVPLDGSKRSEAILPQVEDLAVQCKARLVLLEVLEPLPQHAAAVAPDLLSSGASQRADDIKQYVHGLQEQLAAKGFDVSAIVKRGSVVDTILAVAMAEKVELIAMASHGYTGIARFLHGSVASEVLHRAKVPLLVLHAEDDEE